MLEIDRTHLPELNQIAVSYRETVVGYMHQRTARATTPQEALAMLDALINEVVKSGLVLDEEGNEQRLLVGEAAYWTPDQLQAEAQTAVTDTSSNSFGLVILGGLMLLLVWFGWQVFGGSDETSATEDVATLAETSKIEAVSDESLLALSDDFGVRTAIGQPATLQLGQMTFSVLNVPTENRQLPIAEAVQEGELVAQWLAGTVVNQSFGIHPDLLEVLLVEQEMGSLTAVIRTDTAQTHAFRCAEKRTLTLQQTELLAQDRPGLTLFPLPAPSQTFTALWCPYDPTHETSGQAVTASIGETIRVGDVSLMVETLTAHETSDGQLAVDVAGTLWVDEAIVNPASATAVLGLLTNSGNRYSPIGDTFQAEVTRNRWLATFQLPLALEGETVFLVVQSPLGESAQIVLPTLPMPKEQLAVMLKNPQWEAGTLTLDLIITNEGDSTAYVTPDSIMVQQAGAVLPLQQTDLPILIHPQQQKEIVIGVVPTGEAVVEIGIGNGRWQVTYLSDK